MLWSCGVPFRIERSRGAEGPACRLARVGRGGVLTIDETTASCPRRRLAPSFDWRSSSSGRFQLVPSSDKSAVSTAVVVKPLGDAEQQLDLIERLLVAE